MATPDYDIIKEIPGYKVILKSVLKSQIQQLVEQLASSTDEESVILTASVADGTLSHLGSESGKGFLEDHEDIKSQFLGFCLKKHHKKKEEEKERQEAEALQQSMQVSPMRYGPRGAYPSRSMRFPTHQRHGMLHPVAMTRAPQGSHMRSPSARHEPYPITRPPRKPSIESSPSTAGLAVANTDNGQIIKLEPDNEASNQSVNDSVDQDIPSSPHQPSNHPSSVTVKPDSGDKDEDALSESSTSTIPNEPTSEGLGLDSDLSNLISGPSEQSVEGGEVDTDISVKLEAITENEMELEITGVEPGRPIVSQDDWDPNISMGMNFDPTGATGNMGDLASPGYMAPWMQNLKSLPTDQYMLMEPEPYTVLRNGDSSVFTCAYVNCGKYFSSKYLIERHVKIHLKDKPFACRFCEYKCVRKDYLRVHENTQHAPLVLDMGI